MPLTYDPVKGAPEVDLRQVQESAGEFASGLRVFTTAPGTTQTQRVPLTYDPVKGAPEVDLRQVQESAGEFAMVYGYLLPRQGPLKLK